MLIIMIYFHLYLLPGSIVTISWFEEDGFRQLNAAGGVKCTDIRSSLETTLHREEQGLISSNAVALDVARHVFEP